MKDPLTSYGKFMPVLILLIILWAGMLIRSCVQDSSGEESTRSCGVTAKNSEDPKNIPQYKLYRVTAYCSCPKCCGKWADGYFASGRKVCFGGVAADKRLPYGTEIVFREPVRGRRRFRVEDRGSAIKGRRLDIYFPTHKEALQFGVKYLNARVIKPGGAQ